MPLTAPAISELAVETSVLALMEEFLKGYFDGIASPGHTVGLNTAVVFPKAELRFQQSALTQPLEKSGQPAPASGLGITMVWRDPSRKWTGWEEVETSTGVFTRQEMKYARTNFTFWIRDGGSDANRVKRCREASELLAGLLENSHATKPLAQKGIKRLRPGTPQPIESNQFALRMLTVAATLRWPVKSQVNQLV